MLIRSPPWFRLIFVGTGKEAADWPRNRDVTQSLRNCEKFPKCYVFWTMSLLLWISYYHSFFFSFLPFCDRPYPYGNIYFIIWTFHSFETRGNVQLFYQGDMQVVMSINREMFESCSGHEACVRDACSNCSGMNMTVGQFVNLEMKWRRRRRRRKRKGDK